jgi:UDP-N-acetylmuramoyl-L-alanyl-D-glutamate--2,6-diaminopimelate ligase
MRLSDLASAAASRLVGTGDAEIAGMTFDSRAVKPGDLFAALVGEKADGHRFVAQAVAAGAAAALVERRVDGIAVPQVIVPDSRAALGKIAARFYDHPSKRIKVVGVTGTKGKTTTAYLIRSIAAAAGKRAGMIGTISYSFGAEDIPAVNTTPESLVVQRLLSEMLKHGCDLAAMEVSSIALEEGRVDDVTFAAGLFTNLSHEHIDYHKDMTNYARAKGKLFGRLAPGAPAVVNADADFLSEVLGSRARNVLRFGFGDGADVRVTRMESLADGSRFEVASPWGRVEFRTALPGRHNVYNCLGAAAVMGALGTPPAALVAGVAALENVSGRLERVDEGQPFAVFVDYAHTDDALRNVLSTVRPLTEGRVIAVFGCGGNRDREKRPRMRAVCEELADVCVVTSDNPRNEDPKAIIDEIMRGTRDLRKFTIECDRRAAIRMAIEQALPGDLVLIAGKGHETYQIFKDDRRIHFDDREVAREALREARER